MNRYMLIYLLLESRFSEDPSIIHTVIYPTPHNDPYTETLTHSMCLKVQRSRGVVASPASHKLRRVRQRHKVWWLSRGCRRARTGTLDPSDMTVELAYHTLIWNSKTIYHVVYLNVYTIVYITTEKNIVSWPTGSVQLLAQRSQPPVWHQLEGQQLPLRRADPP